MTKVSFLIRFPLRVGAKASNLGRHTLSGRSRVWAGFIAMCSGRVPSGPQSTEPQNRLRLMKRERFELIAGVRASESLWQDFVGHHEQVDECEQLVRAFNTVSCAEVPPLQLGPAVR